MSTAKRIVNKLLESDDDVDPKAYMMSLRSKRDIVKALVTQYAVRHRWEYRTDSEVLLITFPKEIDFEHLLNRRGVAPANTMGISGGSKNYRLQFMWDKGYLDKLVNESLDDPTPENIAHLTPVVHIEDLYELVNKRLGLQQGYWQWYTHEHGRTDLIITGYAFNYRTSGEAYRALLGVLAPYKIMPLDFHYDEDDHEMTVWLPKHHLQAPEPKTDDFDWSELEPPPQ